MYRILHLAKYYAPFRGGIETHVRGLAQAQATAGHSVTVACVNHLDTTGQDVWSSRTAKTATKEELDGEVKVKRFGKFGTLARFDFCLGIRKYLANTRGQFDIIHLHTPNPVMTLALAMTDPQVPIVVTYHSDIIKQRFIRKPFSVIEHAVFRRASRIIASSQNYLDSSDTLRRHREKCVVIPFGLDLSPYLQPTAAALEYKAHLQKRFANEPLWLTVGRLVYYKGTEFAIRALVDCPGHLMIVGRGSDELHLQNLAIELGVAHRCSFVKDLSDDELVGAYHAATAFWFPSILRSEAFGLVQIEAMASGCPVINANIRGSGVPWVSIDGISGWTVPIQDSKAIADVVNRMLSDVADLSAKRESARKRAIECFSIRRMVDDTTRLYDSILGRYTHSGHQDINSHGQNEPDVEIAHVRS